MHPEIESKTLSQKTCPGSRQMAALEFPQEALPEIHPNKDGGGQPWSWSKCVRRETPAHPHQTTGHFGKHSPLYQFSLGADSVLNKPKKTNASVFMGLKCVCHTCESFLVHELVTWWDCNYSSHCSQIPGNQTHLLLMETGLRYVHGSLYPKY